MSWKFERAFEGNSPYLTSDVELGTGYGFGYAHGEGLEGSGHGRREGIAVEGEAEYGCFMGRGDAASGSYGDGYDFGGGLATASGNEEGRGWAYVEG